MTPRLRCEPQLDYLALRRGSHRGARRQYCSYPAPNFRLSAGSSHKQIQRIRQPTPRALTVERCPTRPARPSRRSNTWDSGGGRALHNQFLRGIGRQLPARHRQGPKTGKVKLRDRGHLKKSTRYSRLRSRRPSGRSTSMRRAFVSMLVQISTASGIKISPSEVSTSRSGVPEIPSPGNCTSRTIPSKDGASERKHGEEAKTGGDAGVSNTEHPMRSETKYCPAGRVTRCSNGSSTSKPRNFSASEIESTPSK